MSEGLNRREFLTNSALAGVAGIIGASSLFSCNGNGGRKSGLLIPEDQWDIPESLPDKADDGKPLRVGLIGCGNRGAGAVNDLLTAASNISVVALGDLFQDRIDYAKGMLKEKFNQEIADANCFTGFESYKCVLNTGVDMVILTTPPAFRPLHFKAAVEAGKHAFLEKPVAVDPVGARSVIATSKAAEAKGLSVITGTQRHHERKYIESYKQVQSGMIGEILSGKVFWNTGSHWYRNKDPKWTDLEWMIRDWGNWNWLSGDHIVEQHVHNIDVFNWFTGKKPAKALGMGARQHRNTGDQFDMFSVDFVYEGGISLHSMCRQIDGCSNSIYEFIQGTKGAWSSDGIIKDNKGNVLWQYDKEKEKTDFKQTNPYVLEHVNWVNHIRRNMPVSLAEHTAISTLTAIMGRISAYTGKEVTWDQMLASDLDLLPADLQFRNLDMSGYPVPSPGTSTKRKDNQR